MEKDEHLKRNRNSHSMFGLCFFIQFKNNLKSEATSLFDVQCSMLDVHLSKISVECSVLGVCFLTKESAHGQTT